MNKYIRTVANQFAVYHKLGLYDQWKLRRSLRWAYSDTVSVELLIEFEKKFEGQLIFSWDVFNIILHALSWYNREDHDERLQDRLPPSKLSEMLQVVLVFLTKSPRLHYKYRDLVLKIVGSSDKVGNDAKIITAITSEQFRREVTQSISILADRLNGWYGWYPNLERGGNLIVKYLENIAGKISDPELFTRYRVEADKAFSNRGWFVEQLNYLEKIADKVNDLPSFSQVFDQMVPLIGLETMSSLITICRDFQETEIFFNRIAMLVKQWGSEYTHVFRQSKNTGELARLLVFLEILPTNIRMTRYVQYTQTHSSGTLFTYISGALHAQKGYVLDACSKHDWIEGSEIDRFANSMVDQFEQDIVNKYLSSIWNSSIKNHKMRWEFNEFTKSINYEMINWDWTRDDEKTRPYWNSRAAEGQEYHRFISELEPRLLSLIRTMDLSELEALFDLLPGLLGIEEFSKTVSVPVEWDKAIEYVDGYNKWSGEYTERVEVGRPKRFKNHVFIFDRPHLQAALELLDSPDKIHAAIQTQKNSHV